MATSGRRPLLALAGGFAGAGCRFRLGLRRLGAPCTALLRRSPCARTIHSLLDRRPGSARLNPTCANARCSLLALVRRPRCVLAAYADQVAGPAAAAARRSRSTSRPRRSARRTTCRSSARTARPLPTYALKRSVLRPGQRERALHRSAITNPTAHRVEAVVSVDGLDVVDGENGDLRKRGYVVPAVRRDPHRRLPHVARRRRDVPVLVGRRLVRRPEGQGAQRRRDRGRDVRGAAPRPSSRSSSAPQPLQLRRDDLDDATIVDGSRRTPTRGRLTPKARRAADKDGAVAPRPHARGAAAGRAPRRRRRRGGAGAVAPQRRARRTRRRRRRRATPTTTELRRRRSAASADAAPRRTARASAPSSASRATRPRATPSSCARRPPDRDRRAPLQRHRRPDGARHPGPADARRGRDHDARDRGSVPRRSTSRARPADALRLAAVGARSRRTGS